jgi:hypothetical protein
MGEMVLVLVVVMLLATGGVVWWSRSAGRETERVLDEEGRLALAQTAHGVADLPELRYAVAGREDPLVLDWLRVQAFAANVGIEGREVYRERFAGYRAVVTCVTPCSDGTVNTAHVFPETTLFDYTDPVAADRNSVPFVIPVLLHDPVSGASSFGRLTLTQVIG